MTPLLGTFARCLGHNLLVVLALAAVIALGITTQERTPVNRPPAKGSHARILRNRGRDCWTSPDEHPADLAGKNPASVIVSGDEARDKNTIRRAVEQAYYGIDHGMRIYGFCRA